MTPKATQSDNILERDVREIVHNCKTLNLSEELTINLLLTVVYKYTVRELRSL
jgi:hypothetical protein